LLLVYLNLKPTTEAGHYTRLKLTVITLVYVSALLDEDVNERR
jgi:hypothetical protein